MLISENNMCFFHFLFVCLFKFSTFKLKTMLRHVFFSMFLLTNSIELRSRYCAFVIRCGSKMKLEEGRGSWENVRQLKLKCVYVCVHCTCTLMFIKYWCIWELNGEFIKIIFIKVMTINNIDEVIITHWLRAAIWK